MVNQPNPELRTIIGNIDGAETMVRYAENLGRNLKNAGLTTSQIRALFGEVRQIQAQWSMGGDQQRIAARRLVLLKPKMPIARGEAAKQWLTSSMCSILLSMKSSRRRI